MSHQTIGLINYGMVGNVYSVKKAIEKAGGMVKIITDQHELGSIDKIVMPGVGSFKDVMIELQKDNMIEALKQAILSKPTLGICLGMQIFAKIGFEYGKTEGLGLIDAEVKQVVCADKVPHMGFNKINVVNQNELLKGLDGEEFYFMHSFECINYMDIASLTKYTEHVFVSSVKKANIYGVQFHPEKSRDAGIELFKNFIRL